MPDVQYFQLFLIGVIFFDCKQKNTNKQILREMSTCIYKNQPNFGISSKETTID